MEDYAKLTTVVVGGTVMDFRGRPIGPLQLHTSNPGGLQQMPGGVGRNIAENLVRLGTPPLLISGIGTDLTGEALLQHAQSIGLPTQGLIQFEGHHTAIYLAILDGQGDLHTAIADMAIFDQLTPERLVPFVDQLSSASLVLLDTNLPVATIRFISEFCQERQVPLWVEPVSMEKSRKLADILPAITYISPNREELEALTGLVIESQADLEEGVRHLLASGVDYVLVTLGQDGVLLGKGSPSKTGGILKPDGATLESNPVNAVENTDGSAKVSETVTDLSRSHGTNLTYFPAPQAHVVDVTGAGDSFVAGTVFGITQGLTIEQAIPYGLATAKLTVETADTVYQNLDHLLLQQM